MNYLLDTSIVLDYGDRLSDLIDTGDKIFLTDIVLQELDGHKNDENKEKGYNAREFFRKMGNADNKKSEFKTIEGDFATCYDIDGVEVTVIVRNRYKTRDINDSKIIEIAKDYGFTLLTRDMAQSVRAKAVNAKARVITGDFKFEVSDEKAEEMLNAIMNSKIDVEVKFAIKDFYNICKANIDFIEAGRDFIFNVYKFYILRQSITLENGVKLSAREFKSDYKVLTSSDKGKSFSKIDTKSASIDEEVSNPIFSHLGGNIHNNTLADISGSFTHSTL